MNLSFFHDSCFKKVGNSYYTSGGLNNTFLAQYLDYFEKVTITTREEVANTNTNKLSKVDLRGITFDCIKKTHFLRNFCTYGRKKIKYNIANSDFSIIRLPSIIGTYACIQCNRQKKPYLIEMVACPFDALWNYGKIQGKVLAPIMAIITKRCVRKANNVCYVSNAFLQKRYPNTHNTAAISDVKIQHVDKSVLDKRIEKIDNYTSDKVYKFGLIGSLNIKYKGHNTAIRSLSNIKDEIKFELHFLGTYNERAKKKWIKYANKYKIQDYVYFDGVLPGGNDVFKWMDDIDIYLIPSLQEGLPRALVEAMSRASVCIGVNTGGIPELLEKDKIVKRRNDKQMSDLIIKIIRNKQIMKEAATNNYNKAKDYEDKKLSIKRKKFYKNMFKKEGIST